ncbi:MAG TPA: bifunctional diguanylate cyclase/phosphodiesterase [Xanthobacteraceae bacterium]|jgi:diguanylate cyclase (GGDEF)-like protein
MRKAETAAVQTERDSTDRAGRGTAMLRLSIPLARVLLAAIALCTALAYMLARQADDRLESEHRAALAGAVEALAAVSPDLARTEPKLIHILERASGLRQLKFESDPESGRELQPMLDGKGRIIGWFSWEAERPATALLVSLLPFLVGIALGLLGWSKLATHQLGRLGVELARSKQHAQMLEHLDMLTGLPNHRHFLALLDQALLARKNEEELAFAVIDLDRFDEINDALGWPGGDEVLVEIGDRLARSAPPAALLGRLGSDEFALLLPGVDREKARAAAESVRLSLARPLWKDQVVAISSSIGLAVAPGDGVLRDELSRRAHLALRFAKQRGPGSVVCYSPDMQAELDERRFVKREIARALAARAFEVHYQPIVGAQDGAMLGVEALLRWNHPTRGFVPPSLFVPVAEEAGLMDGLGELVLRQAIADATRWPGLYVSVNLSPVQVRDRAFGRLLAAVLKETRFDPSRLMLEMTESVLIHNPEETRARLMELRCLGVLLALDDFGSGYSSLSYLQKLPFDKLKIDRSFALALDRSGNAPVIIQAIVALGRALGMGVVIEGVETQEQRVLLRLAGCSEMQGYLFGRPSVPDDIDRLLRSDIRAPGSAAA